MKHVFEHEPRALDKSDGEMMKKALINFKKAREQPPQAPKQYKGDSDWNILTKFCAEKKKDSAP